MKRSSLGLLLASTAAAALIGACSSGDDSGGLLGRSSYGGSSGGPSVGNTSGSSSGSSSGSAMSSSSSGSSSGGTTSGSSSGVATAPPPDAGPGSTSSAAHEFFNATVYPEIASTCGSCHASGANGAPTMMAPPADNTYSSLDGLGLIVSNSLLLTKGTHDNGAAPALTTQESTDITTWLGMEATERAGSAAPTNILAEIAQCASSTEFEAIGFGKLRTVPRPTENADKCSGCNNAMCASCHDGGEQGFFMAEGSNIEPAGTTFQQTFGPASVAPQSMTYIIQYFGLNGTTPVPSNALMLKQTAVATGPAYSHPMFTMSATMQTALTTFVNDAITGYTNKTCGGDAGTVSDDAGP
jgi:cytochrome c553